VLSDEVYFGKLIFESDEQEFSLRGVKSQKISSHAGTDMGEDSGGTGAWGLSPPNRIKTVCMTLGKNSKISRKSMHMSDND